MASVGEKCEKDDEEFHIRALSNASSTIFVVNKSRQHAGRPSATWTRDARRWPGIPSIREDGQHNSSINVVIHPNRKLQQEGHFKVKASYREVERGEREGGGRVACLLAGPPSSLALLTHLCCRASSPSLPPSVALHCIASHHLHCCSSSPIPFFPSLTCLPAPAPGERRSHFSLSLPTFAVCLCYGSALDFPLFFFLRLCWNDVHLFPITDSGWCITYL